jgi:hypothetical protein
MKSHSFLVVTATVNVLATGCLGPSKAVQDALSATVLI